VIRHRLAYPFLPMASAAVLAVSLTSVPAAQAATVIGPPTLSGPGWPAYYVGAPGPFKTGVPIALTLAPGTGATPVRYLVQVNGGQIKTVQAASGSANIAVVPTGRTGSLNVTAVAVDGTRSSKVSEKFIGIGAKPAANQDINGDGVPDLVTVGGTPGLTSGLWLASGVKNGRVRVPAKNIGALGAGFNTAPSPSDFDGGQVIVGNYFGDGFQDFLVYFTSGLRANSGAVLLAGSGDGSVVDPISGNGMDLFGNLADYNGDNPLQFANAYNSAGANGGDDLIAISGDAINGYYLNYYESGSYGSLLSPPQLEISTNTPDGTPDWQNWKMTTTQVPSGTAMYLWKPSTGALYLWEGVKVKDNGNFTGAITFTQYQISKSWNKGATFPTLQAANFVPGGVPGLWTVSPAGVGRAYTISGLSVTSTAKISAGAPQKLS
jgi:hypothetical protein